VPAADEPDDCPRFDVGPVDGVAPGCVVPFAAGGRRFLVCNAKTGFYAVAERCTHAAWSLAGAELRGEEIVCALHGARFDLRTGHATCPPASKPLRTYAVDVEGGRIRVRVPPPIE